MDSVFAGALTFMVVLFALSVTGRDSRVCAAIALIAAYCACVIARGFMNKRPRLRKRRLLADKRVKALIYLDSLKAHEEVFKLLSARYPISDASFESGHIRFTHMHSEQSILCVIQKLRVSPDDLLTAWRAHGQGGSARAIVVCIPGRSEQDVRVAALRLSKPNVVVIDKRQLRAMTRKHGKLEAPEARARGVRPMEVLHSFVTRRRAWRYLLYACLLNAYYLITGKALYLAFSLALVCVTALSLSKREEPEQLI